MESTTQKIIEAIESKKENYIDGECCLCGGTKTFQEWFSFKKTVSTNFTDNNIMADKTNDQLCYFCKQCLNNNYMDSPKGKKCGIRLYSFLIENEKFRIIDLKEREYFIFEYKYKPPFILCVSFSGQKHISFKAVESHNKNNFNICTENGNIYFEREKWKPYFDIMKYYYENKITKNELAELSIKPWKFNKYNLDIFKIQKLREIKNTAQYQFMINILYKERKENENKSQG